MAVHVLYNYLEDAAYCKEVQVVLGDVLLLHIKDLITQQKLQAVGRGVRVQVLRFRGGGLGDVLLLTSRTSSHRRSQAVGGVGFRGNGARV